MHKYWVVHNLRHGYTTKYDSVEEAIAEARRLAAENPGEKFNLVEATKENYGLTETQLANAGRAIAEAFNLTRSDENPDRWDTKHGTKTDLGLGRMTLRLALETLPISSAE